MLHDEMEIFFRHLFFFFFFFECLFLVLGRFNQSRALGQINKRKTNF